MSTTVQLPSQFKMASLYSFTRQIVGHDGPLDDRFEFDFARLQFIDGYGLTVLCNTLEWLGNHGVRRVFINFRGASAAKLYLDDCGFFERYLGQPLRPESRVRSTTLPFTPVAHAEAHGWLEYRFTPWAAPALGVRPGALTSVRACIGEIFNNILDHSTQDIGFVHAQHYPNMKTLNITVSDFGRGIPNTIRSSFGNLRDDVAILRASTRGVTTKSNPNNQGVGLDYLITNVTTNGGRVRLYSFSGALICSGDGAGGIRREALIGNGSYPGTLVDILLRTDCFVGDEEERENVEW
jgi:hypothetical protein